MAVEPFFAIICWYDEDTVDDRRVATDALNVEKQNLPISLYNGEGRMECIGQINRVDELSDGRIAVFGKCDRDGLPLDDDGNPMYGLGMDIVNADFEMDDKTMVMVSGRLAGVSVVKTPAFPKARMEFLDGF